MESIIPGELESTIPSLRELHRTLLQAAPLHEDLSTYATLLAPCLPGERSQVSVAGVAPYVCGVDVSPPWDSRDITLLKLSLIQILVIKSDNLCIEPHVRCQYAHVLELLQQTGAHATIIGLLHTTDKVLSHISSKCLSHLVLFQLKCENEVNAHWLQFCLKSLCQDPGSRSLIPCLTSMLSVCKGILMEERLQSADLLMKILVPLENVFEIFCSTFITYLSKSSCQPTALIKEVNIQLSCLLDLLEALVALRIQLKLNVSLCKQVLSVILPEALNIIFSPVPYCVKKQFLLVLKRCLLYKAAEDFLPTARISSQPQDGLLDKDMAVLAGMLLGAVQRGWLLQVPVSDRVNSFGGVNEGSQHGTDLVMLGAVCLSVLKALEIQLHHGAFSGGQAGPARILDLETLMTHLVEFSKPHIGWTEPMHPCEWVSLIFIQQDDDMLEVAKCLLKMYQHNPSLCTTSLSSQSDKSIWGGPSHQHGCNPHCIFLFLLSNVSFDSSVLLDFLISSETCFLEYFVRYLKMLKDDWPHFCLICTSFEKSTNFQSPTVASVSVCPQSGQSATVKPIASDSINLPNLLSSTPMDISSFASSSLQTNHTERSTPSVPAGSGRSSLGALQRLVDYDSSEDSDAEIADREHGLVAGHLAGADTADIDKHMGKLELKALSAQTPATQPNAQAGGIQQRAVQCLHNLRESIARLHRKKLFPYNPSALLRLLSLVGDQSTERQ